MSTLHGKTTLFHMRNPLNKFQQETKATIYKKKEKKNPTPNFKLKPNQHAISMGISWLVMIMLILMLSGCPWPIHNHNDNSPIETTAPTANFMVSASTGKAPLIISFTDNSTDGSAPITSWLWDFGDGGTSQDQNPQYTFKQSGVFDISLMVTSKDGTHTTKQTAAITVDAADIIATFTLVDEKGLSVDGVIASSETFTIEKQSYNEYQQLVIALRPNQNSGVLSFFKEGFLKNVVYFDSLSTHFQRTKTMFKKASKILIEGSLGGEFYGKAGANITLTSDSLIKADGTSVTGTVELYLTPINIEDRVEVNAFPGAFLGIPEDINESQQDIFSYGVLDITLMQGSEELQLKSGATAEIEIPIYAINHPTGVTINVGDIIPHWTLNSSTGVWLQEGNGIVVNNYLAPYGKSLKTSISHFSPHNADYYIRQAINTLGTCDISIDIIGAKLNEPLSIKSATSIVGNTFRRNDRDIIYKGKGINATYIRSASRGKFSVEQNNKIASAQLSCSADESAKLYTLTLDEQPPTFINWIIDIEPIFSKNSPTSPYKITENTVRVGALFSGDENGIGEFNISLVNHKIGLPAEQQFEAQYLSTDESTIPISIDLSNDYGSVTQTTNISFITEASPTIGTFQIYPSLNNNTLNYIWKVKGADSISVYYLGDDVTSLGIEIFTVTGEAVDIGDFSDNQLVGAKGYIRIDYRNQYGEGSKLGRLSNLTCDQDSEASYCFGGASYQEKKY